MPLAYLVGKRLVKRVIFVSSSGRSGSKALAAALDLPGVHSLHGPLPRVERANCLHHRGQLQDPHATVRAARKKLVIGTLRRDLHYVESSWFLCSLGAVLKDVFPGCRLIHLVRDGRDFVRSGMARPWFKNDRKYLAKPWSWSRDRWHPPPQANSRIAKIAWLWAAQQNSIAAHADSVLRLEDLIADGLVLSDLGLPMSTRVLLPRMNATENHVIPRWPDWTAPMRADFDRWASPVLARYGYSW